MRKPVEATCVSCGFLFWVLGLVRGPYVCQRCAGEIRDFEENDDE